MTEGGLPWSEQLTPHRHRPGPSVQRPCPSVQRPHPHMQCGCSALSASVQHADPRSDARVSHALARRVQLGSRFGQGTAGGECSLAALFRARLLMPEWDLFFAACTHFIHRSVFGILEIRTKNPASRLKQLGSILAFGLNK